MTRVYADPTLPYNQTSTFSFPGDIDLCEREFYGEFTDETEAAESIQGVFD
ncbi:MAG: hypothetical protein K2K86_01845 [Muribaculaceae bacterium]|nr:hypothetical protein [Muribaculaceae bacterium]